MVEVVALIRFSFLSSTDDGYRLAKDVMPTERAAELFAKERLSRRFKVFESVCLPSLRSQPAERFHAIILASAAMPDPYKERLLSKVRDDGNISVAFEEPAAMPYEQLWLKHIKRISGLNKLFATSRLDDDDAISSEFTTTLAQYIKDYHIGHAISFPLGLQVGFDGSGPRFWESYWPLVAAGLSFVCSREDPLTVFSCGHHHRIPRARPVILDARSFQYVVTVHEHNDSLIGKGHPLGRRFPILRKLKRSVWPGPRGHQPPEDRKIPAQTWSIDEAENQAPQLIPLLRGCDWRLLAV